MLLGLTSDHLTLGRPHHVASSINQYRLIYGLEHGTSSLNTIYIGEMRRLHRIYRFGLTTEDEERRIITGQIVMLIGLALIIWLIDRG